MARLPFWTETAPTRPRRSTVGRGSLASWRKGRTEAGRPIEHPFTEASALIQPRRFYKALHTEREEVFKALFYIEDEDLPVAHESIRPALLKRQQTLRARHDELSRQIAAFG